MASKTRLAKLTRPTNAAACSRPRLFAEFDPPHGTPVAWLAGPPGCGKTTLIADYTTQRGLDALWGMYQWLDRAPKGRNDTGAWFRPRDEY